MWNPVLTGLEYVYGHHYVYMSRKCIYIISGLLEGREV